MRSAKATAYTSVVARKIKAATSKANFTMGDMSKPSPKKPCGACARRRAKIVNFFKRFKKGTSNGKSASIARARKG